jgi:hypothetical protein
MAERTVSLSTFRDVSNAVACPLDRVRWATSSPASRSGPEGRCAARPPTTGTRV